MLAPNIYTLLIPIQHKLSNQEFKDLVEAPSVEEFRRRLNETYYGKKYEFGEQVQIESIVNECMETYLNDRLQKPSVFSGKYTTIFIFKGGRDL